MATEETVSVSRASACLCVLCGLPAAGKSTLARRILSTATQHGWRATVVPYDDLIPEQAFRTKVVEDGVNLQEMHTEWKSHRQAVLYCIEQFLQKSEILPEAPSSSGISVAAWEQCTQALMGPKGLKPPLVFLLDDNFYYPNSLGFCQVYLQCDLESCVSRNQSRSQPVPTEVILEMVKRLESPNPQKNSWEINSITLNSTGTVSKSDIQRVMELISSALNNPLSLGEDNKEQKDADRLKCANSVVHQADQACRHLISEAMKTARENKVPPERMRSLAAQLSESKATFLHNLRKHFLHEVPFIQEEEINVEHAAKRAAEIFNDDLKEILSRIMNDK
ncbi:L-seryl-tRNA(Sec) kinase isoform X2 [Pelmatolapia mariae]|uniref:L-seryl-tRNA(Sec) kinase isoform X2 n=1 Tax=Pelmatolapia mariae TaxID=158779 RepID=UPI002FE53860